MNELTVQSIESVYGSHFAAGFARAAKVINSIQSWNDVETLLLRGQGLAAGTYRTYLTAIRQLYEYTEGLNPYQVTPGHVEAFYDEQAARVGLGSCYNKMAALKNFFRSIGKLAPGWCSPFDVMEPQLVKKLTRQPHKGTKKSLTRDEVRDLLDFLARDRSVRGQQDHAAVWFLVTSGLRAAEFCGLTWADISLIDGISYATFLGKGGKPAEQPLYGPAVVAMRSAFTAHFNRAPRPADHLMYTTPAVSGAVPAPITPHVLWWRCNKIGKAVHEIITRELTFSPHLFRRSFATSLYKSGMKLKAIQELTRHSDISTLATHYIDDREDPSPYFDKMFQEGAAE